jgi:hypothetical protein
VCRKWGVKGELEKETSPAVRHRNICISSVWLLVYLDLDLVDYVMGLRAKLRNILLFLLFRQADSKHKVKAKIGYFEPLLAMISPLLLTFLGLHVLSYGFLAFILYYIGVSLVLLEIFHIAFDKG